MTPEQLNLLIVAIKMLTLEIGVCFSCLIVAIFIVRK